MTHIGISTRVRVNIEALNMTESIGYVSKHRRAPYLLRTSEGYKLVYVPAISGESLAHAYQANLVDATNLIYESEGIKDELLPLDEWSRRYEFIKFTASQYLTEELKGIYEKYKNEKNPKRKEEGQHKFEKKAIESSIIADIGGFMLAEENFPVRRTSLFQVGYATPVEEVVMESLIEAQMHARQAIVGLVVKEKERATQGEEIVAESSTEAQIGQRQVSEEPVAERKEKKGAQMLYYVEISSTVYGMMMHLDLSSIGMTSMVRKEYIYGDDENKNKIERKRRAKAALLALVMTLGLQLYGAKRSRFTPVTDIENIVVVLSKPLPILPVPPQKKEYIEETIRKVSGFKPIFEELGITEEAQIMVYGYKPGEIKEGVKIFNTPEELFQNLIDEVLKEFG